MAFRMHGWKMTQEGTGKYVPLDLAGKGRTHRVGYSFPKDVPDRARKIREQATALMRIADRLDRRASALEKNRPGGKVIDFLKRYLRKKAMSAEPA